MDGFCNLNGVELTRQYLEYIDEDYVDEIQPLNQSQFNVDSMKILKSDIREDMYKSIFEAKGVSYEYADEIFNLVEMSKVDSNPDDFICRLESIAAYANGFEPNTRGDYEYDENEFEEELFESMNLISDINYGVLTELYGDKLTGQTILTANLRFLMSF